MKERDCDQVREFAAVTLILFIVSLTAWLECSRGFAIPTIASAVALAEAIRQLFIYYKVFKDPDDPDR